jgi:hypothetical protein
VPKICRKCNNEFPFRVVVDGKERNLKSRKFCLDCSPFGKRNTRDLTKDYSIAHCKDCEESKPVADFYIKTDGRPYSYCKLCHNTRRNRYFRSNKEKAVAYLGGACEICGYDKSPAAFDFHHRDPTQKDFNISKYRGASIEKIKPELDKCALLCANCHREVHFNENLSKQIAEIKPRVFRPKVYSCHDCGTSVSRRVKRCMTCHSKKEERVDWPTIEKVMSMVNESNYSAVGRELGVSDNAVRKRIKNHLKENP